MTEVKKDILKPIKAADEKIIQATPDTNFIRLKRAKPKIVKSATEVIGEGQDIVTTIKNTIQEKVEEILEEKNEMNIRHDLNRIAYVLKLLAQLQEIDIKQNRELLWNDELIIKQNNVILSMMETNQIMNQYKLK